MSEEGRERQPQQHCRSCGAEARPGNAYCVSCGAPLTPGAGHPGPTDTGPEPSGRSGHSAGDAGEVLRGATDRIAGAFSRLRAEDLRPVPLRVRRWFGRLPLAFKVALAVLVLLALFTVLSPLASVVAAVAFVVSLIALIIRVAQRRSAVRWGITAVTSLVLTLVLSGAAGIFYGGGSTAETGSSKQEPIPEDGGLQVKPAPAHGDVAPGLERLADRWASSNIESPLFVPSQLPNPPSEVGDNFTDSGLGHPLYAIYGLNYALTLTYAGHPGDGSYRADVPGVGMLTMDDGRSYYYVVEKEDPYYGAYSVAFWNESTFVYKLETSDISIYTPEQFMRTLESMVRVESRGTV